MRKYLDKEADEEKIIAEVFKQSASEKNKSKTTLVLLLAHTVFRIPVEGSPNLPNLPENLVDAIREYNSVVGRCKNNFEQVENQVRPRSYKHIGVVPTVAPVEANIWMYQLYTTKDWVGTLRVANISDSTLYRMCDMLTSSLQKIVTALVRLAENPELDPIVNLFREVTREFFALKDLSATAYRSK
eukprot:TRINITY_DN5563_c0_g1_i1.p1 TRINITY_DN5563_c0_g1~~TRINITY_DN5563_c0_g1_i1.p1  ORF type:complete len:186 (-),score=38.51 TRINITY_DN5563_c0_g1_i1:19-576(-)